MSHWLDIVVKLLQSDTNNLRELARIAGADPRTFYRGIDSRKLDLDGQNIEGIEFSNSPSPEAYARHQQLTLDLKIKEDRTALGIARSIKLTARQEERAARLLAEFLRDRIFADEVFEKYKSDSAGLTNNALMALRDIRSSEILGKKFTNVQVARRVSGRFARTVEKRSILVYYLARYLNQYPEIREWLRGKSLGWLNKRQREEVRQFLES
jgi:hypothetical protein